MRVTRRKNAEEAAIKAAISPFYAGPSLPFKASVKLPELAAVNFDSGNEQTARAAAGIAMILVYCDVASDGKFIRGSGRVPGTGPDLNKTLAVGPESGVLSQLCSGGCVSHISGPLKGHGVKKASLSSTSTHAAKAFKDARTVGVSSQHPYRSFRKSKTAPTKQLLSQPHPSRAARRCQRLQKTRRLHRS